MGLTEANGGWGSHSVGKGRYPPPSVMISPPRPGSHKGNQIAQEHVVKLSKEELCGKHGGSYSLLCDECGQNNREMVGLLQPSTEGIVSFHI